MFLSCDESLRICKSGWQGFFITGRSRAITVDFESQLLFKTIELRVKEMLTQKINLD